MDKYTVETGIYRVNGHYVTRYRIMDTVDGLRADFPLIDDRTTATNVADCLNREDGYKS